MIEGITHCFPTYSFSDELKESLAMGKVGYSDRYYAMSHNSVWVKYKKTAVASMIFHGALSLYGNDVWPKLKAIKTRIEKAIHPTVADMVPHNHVEFYPEPEVSFDGYIFPPVLSDGSLVIPQPFGNNPFPNTYRPTKRYDRTVIYVVESKAKWAKFVDDNTYNRIAEDAGRPLIRHEDVYHGPTLSKDIISALDDFVMTSLEILVPARRLAVKYRMCWEIMNNALYHQEDEKNNRMSLSKRQKYWDEVFCEEFPEISEIVNAKL